MGITIKELSKISGYSCATISRVITNKGNVKKETQEAIEKLLMEHDTVRISWNCAVQSRNGRIS